MEKTTLSNIQKAGFVLWTIIWLLFFISSIFEILRDFNSRIFSIRFYDGIKLLISFIFYNYISIILFKFVYNRNDIGSYLISDKGLNKVKQLWLALLGLLLFKFIYITSINWFVLPSLKDVQHAASLGYDVRIGLKPFTDLFIAALIVWVFFRILRQTIQLKRENDLTI